MPNNKIQWKQTRDIILGFKQFPSFKLLFW